jgi:hypothetical protein
MTAINALTVIGISMIFAGLMVYMYELVFFRTEVKNDKRKKAKGVYKQNKVKRANGKNVSRRQKN